MKNSFTLLSLIALLGSATAQPVITHQSFMSSGANAGLFKAEANDLNDGTDGPNAIWNFGHIQASNPSDIWGGQILPSSQIEGFDLFDDANIGMILPNGKIRYFQNSPGQLSYIGHDGPDDLLTLNNSSIWMTFPFTYGSSVSDDAEGQLTSNCRNYNWNTSSQTEGVGYGTLILPSGTYENVLKVRRVSFAVRTHSELNFERENNIVEHYWISAGHAFPLLYLRQWTNNGCPGSNEGAEACFMAPQQVSAIAEVFNQSFQTSVFPNPARGRAFLRIDSEKSQMFHVMVYDLLGNQAPVIVPSTEVNGTLLITIDTTRLSNGIYTVTVFSDYGKSTQKLIVN